MATTKAAIENLIKAIDEGRTDVVRGVISVYESGELPENDTEDNSLDKLLNSLWTPEGTFMHRAAQNGKCDIVRALLQAGADPGVHNVKHQTALDISPTKNIQDVFSEDLLNCIARSDIGRICQLLASGVSVNLHDSPETRNTPLHWAASFGNRDVIQCLCKRGSQVNAQNANGATPLHDAVEREDARVVSELVALGADPSIVAHSGKYAGKSALDLASHSSELVNLINQSSFNGMGSGDDAHSVTSESTQSLIMHNNSSLHNGPVPPASSGDSTHPPPLMSPDANTGLKFIEPNNTSNAQTTEQKTASTENLDPLSFLWPRPRQLIRKHGKMFKAKEELPIYVSAKPELVRECVEVCLSQHEALRQFVLSVSVSPWPGPSTRTRLPHLLATLNPDTLPGQQTYTLLVTETQVKVHASDVEGLHHALSTFVQLLRAYHGSTGIPQLKIHDSPSLRERGVLLDMSKGRIPTLSCLKNLIDTLASLKINQIQLYHRLHPPNESTPNDWQFPHPSSAVVEVAQYCWARRVELVPVLDVAPAVSYDMLPQLKHTMHHFVSCFVNTRHLCVGPRLSSLLVDLSEPGEDGGEEGELSLEDVDRFLPPTATLVLCAYVFQDLAQSVLTRLPAHVVLAQYGFLADFNFEKPCSVFSQSSVPFYVVPGTAAWNSVAGCPEAAVSNAVCAVRAGCEHGALGLVVSHWAGAGAITHATMAWPAWLTAAGIAWNATVSQEFVHGHLAELMNQHLLWDRAGIAGQVIIELGRAETYLLRCSRAQSGCDAHDLPPEHGSPVWQLLSAPDAVALEHLAPDHLQKAMRHIRKCQGELGRAQLQRHDASRVLAELHLTADLMLAACRIGRALVNAGKNPLAFSGAGHSVVNMGVSNLPPTTKTDLANRLLSLIEQYRVSWLCGQLPHGLHDSLRTLSAMLAQFVPDNAVHDK